MTVSKEESAVPYGRLLTLANSSSYLHDAYLHGDEMAPFICARVVVQLRIPDNKIPAWVAGYFVRLGGKYMQESERAIRAGRKRPSLDEIAGVGHMKSTRWTRAKRRHEAVLIGYVFKTNVQRARASKDGKNLVFMDWEGRPVTILDGRGRPTREFQVALGESVGVAGASDEATYRKVRRLLKA